MKIGRTNRYCIIRSLEPAPCLTENKCQFFMDSPWCVFFFKNKLQLNLGITDVKGPTNYVQTYRILPNLSNPNYGTPLIYEPKLADNFLKILKYFRKI